MLECSVSNNLEKGVHIASLHHFSGRGVELTIGSEPHFRGIIALEKKFPNISLGGGGKIPQDFIWVYHILRLASLSIVK